MKLVVNLKLKPLESQAKALLSTLEKANETANWISEQAFQNKIFKQFNLHKLAYHSAKDKFSLTAQMVVRVIAKVADSYKIQTAAQCAFRKHGSIAYDDRIIRFKPNDSVNLWTVEGRQTIPFQCGEHQRKLLPFLKGEVDLIYRKGHFYLNAVCDIEEPEKLGFSDIIGVDFGIVQIITDSDGESFSGKQIDEIRQTFAHRRRNLQRNGSKASRRKLKQLSGKQRRYQQNTNHQLAKRLVSKAEGTRRAIAIEELKGISKRVTVRKRQRARLNNWAFRDLRVKIEYKAALSGVTVIAVNPKNTSRECIRCSHTARENRVSQSQFVRQSCGYSANADSNAALVIRARALSERQTDLQKSKVA